MLRGLAAGCFVSSIALSAHATPPPLELVRYRGNLTDLAGVGVPKLAAAIGSTDVTQSSADVTLDPATGATSAKVTVELSATVTPVSGFAFYLDEGLSVSAASAPGTAVTHGSQIYAPYRVVSLSFNPPIAAGTSLAITVDYGGTLTCSEATGRALCAHGVSMPYALEGSAFPALVDQHGNGGYNAWGAQRSLTLRLPSGTGVIATGELAEDTDDGTTRVTRWETPGYQSIGGYLAVMGDFDETAASGTSIATSVFGLVDAPTWKPEMASWMPNILSFVDAQAAMPLPYPKLHVVKIPGGTTFPGTAGHGITLLSEDYAVPGPRYFEETLAHENAHQWWGVLVSPTDAIVSRWLTEGLATLAQVDYSAARLVPSAEREAYLARRYREHRLLVRHHTEHTMFPPLVVAQANLVPNAQPLYTIWAYIRSAATLEHFRAALGDDVFATALAAYAKSCAEQRCDTNDFRTALEAASGMDLASVFTGWIYETHFPRLGVGFSQAATADGWKLDVAFTGDDGIVTPLELVIGLEDGTELRRRIVVSPDATTHSFDLPGRARSVRPNPRHDAVVWSRSFELGDLDFDREVDGFDLVQCARAFGRKAELTGAADEGILGADLEFDPRCDDNEDGVIDDADLAPILKAFGTIREDDR